VQTRKNNFETAGILTWMGVCLAHDELLLYQGLWVRWAISFLFSAVLRHIPVGACKEFSCSFFQLGFLALRRRELF